MARADRPQPRTNLPALSEAMLLPTRIEQIHWLSRCATSITAAITTVDPELHRSILVRAVAAALAELDLEIDRKLPDSGYEDIATFVVRQAPIRP